MRFDDIKNTNALLTDLYFVIVIVIHVPLDLGWQHHGAESQKQQVECRCRARVWDFGAITDTIHVRRRDGDLFSVEEE